MAKSQSKKRLRELFQEQVEEKTYFDFRLSLDGTLVVPRDDVKPSDTEIYKDIDGEFYEEEETVVFSFNQKVKKELSKTFRRILKNRSIAPLDSITLSHPEVRKAIADYGKNVDPNTQERIRQEVVQKYEPEYEIALYESVMLVMVEKDLFKPSKLSRGGISVDTKIEVDIDEDFWTSQSPEADIEEDDGLYDQLKFGNYIEKMERIVRDKTNPLEYMIAVVDTLIIENELFGEEASELAKVVVANVYVTANREAVIADGLEPFLARMESLLPEFMGNGSGHVEWANPSGGVPVMFRTTGSQSGAKEGNVTVHTIGELVTNDSGAESED